MTTIPGKVAVVTGAGSGIGRALAVELARRGAKVAISDVDLEGLGETEALVKAAGGDVKADHLDVSQRELVEQYAEQIKQHFGVVHLVFNNAGIAFTGEIEKMSYKDIDRVMDVDFWGVVHGTKAFLPYLIESGDGHVINVSSIFGLFSMPTQSAYNAAKFAVRGFTESLRQELRNDKRPVQVTCVHPGGIKTNIARNAEASEGRNQADLAKSFDKVAKTTPDKAAQVILKGVEKNKARVLIGSDAIVLDGAVRVLGSKYQRVFGWAGHRFGL